MAYTMKNSGVAWIGDIPAHWEVKRFSNFFEKKAKIVQNLHLPTLSLSFGKVILKKIEVTDDTKKSYQEVQVNNVVINPLNLNYDLLSLRTGVSEHHGCMSSGYIVLNFKNGNLNYFKYLLYVFDILEMKNMGGGVRQTVSFNDLKRVTFIEPSIEEQRAIAQFLDDRTSAIDSKIEALKEKEESLAQLRKSIIHKAVTKGLDPKVPMKASGVDWIGDVPAHWEVKRVKDILHKLIAGKSIDLESLKDTGYPVYGSNGIRGYAEKYMYEGNFWLIGRQGSAGSVNLASGKFWPAEHALVAIKKSIVNHTWLGFLLQDMNLPQYAGGSAQPGLAASFIQKLNIAYPSQEEQRAIATYLDERTSVIDQSIDTVKNEIEALQELRKSLIHEAVTGKLDVADFGYNY